MDLRAAWEENAADWAAWARAPGHDSYWRFHRDQFLEILPAPGRRTLDVGCGEGRLSRDLARLGHTVVGVDGSETLVRLAREAAPALEVHVADAARLPFEDGAFDLAVGFMSLQDVDDMPGAVREAARVLEPGGRLCLAIVHPLNSAGAFTSEDPGSPFVIEGAYLDRFRYADDIERDGMRMRFDSMHRPLEDYVEALAAAGFVVERLREPAVPEAAVRHARSRRWQRVPLFLHLGGRREG